MAINLMNIISPKEFEQIQNDLVKESKGLYTLDSLNDMGFTYENHLLYALNLNDRGYFPEVEEDINSLASFTNKKKFAEKLSYFNEVVYGKTTQKEKFAEIKRLLLEHGIYSKYEMNKIGFTYDRYQSFGPNAFFKNIYYKKTGKRGSKPLKDRMFISNTLPGFQETIGPGEPLFEIDNSTKEINAKQASFDFNNPNSRIINKEPVPEPLFNPYQHLQSVSKPEQAYVQRSLFDPPVYEPLSSNEKFNRKIVDFQNVSEKVKDKTNPLIIKKPEELAITVPTYPLQFFDNADETDNNKMLDFVNSYVVDHSKNRRGYSAQMVGFSEEGIRMRQTKAAVMDRDFFGDTDVVNKQVMVLLPEGQRKKEAVGLVKQGKDHYKLVAVDMDYDSEGRAFVRNLSVKSSATITDPLSSNLYKHTLNDVDYINMRSIGDTHNGLQEALNEDYQKIFDIFFENDGNVNSINLIGEELNRTHRLINGRPAEIISDATMISTRHAVSSDGIYNGRIIISGNNLINSMFNVSDEKRKELESRGYNQGRYSLETDNEGKIKGIYKAISKDGKIEYVKDDDMYNTVFDKDISQYTDSYVMERAKVVDTDVKNIVSEKNILSFNERIRNIDRTSEQQVSELAIEIRDVIFNEFANVYGYSNYNELLKDVEKNDSLRTVYESFLEKFDRLDLDTIKARIETGQMFDNRLVNIKDKTTSAGMERILSNAFMLPLSYWNSDNARKNQAVQQLSAFGFNNLEGERVVIARMLDQHTNHIKELEHKKIQIKRIAEDNLAEFFGKAIIGDNFVAPDLSANTVTYLYGDFSETFNDSVVVSALASIKNIGDTERKTKLRIDYSSLKAGIVKGLGEDYNKVGILIDQLQNGKLNIYEAAVEGTFSNVFLKNLLGEDNFKRMIAYKASDGLNEDLEKLGDLFANIENLKGKNESKYAEASRKARIEYNRILKKYMMLSDSPSRINIVNKDVVNKNVKTYVSDVTAGLIENITADATGIEIEIAQASLPNSGHKLMITGTKGTMSKELDAMFIKSGKNKLVVDALVNNKLNNAKRGNAGTVLSLSIESMLRNTIAGNFKEGDISNQRKLEIFKEIFSEQDSLIAGKASIFDILNIDFFIGQNGDIMYLDKNIQNALNNTKPSQRFDVYTTIEGRIRENAINNIKKVLGREINDNDAESLYQTLLDKMYYAYDKVLERMTQEGKEVAQIRFLDPEITNYYTGSDGKEYSYVKKVKGYVYRFTGNMNRMSESTSRKNSEAMTISRITKLMATNSGNKEFIDLIESLATEQNKDTVLSFSAINDIDERGRYNNRDLYSDFRKNSRFIDVSDAKYRDLGFGINDTLERFQQGPLGNIITEVREQDNSVDLYKIKTMITGVDQDFLDEIDDFFKKSNSAKKDITQIMYMSALDELLSNNDVFIKSDNTHFALGVDSEIANKLNDFRAKVLTARKSMNPKLYSNDLLNINNDYIQHGDFGYVHNFLTEALGKELGIISTKEFQNFKTVEGKIEDLFSSFSSEDKEIKQLVSYLRENLGLTFSENDVKNNFDRIVSQVRDVIKVKKITEFGDEGLLDVLKETDRFNENYYKFATSVTNMLDRLNGINEKFDNPKNIFAFNNLINFTDINPELISKYEDITDSNIVKSIVREYNSLNDGKIIHLAKLKQLLINKELPVYVTGLLTDENGRMIPNSALSNLFSLTEDLANLYAKQEYRTEYDKILNFDKSKIKLNRRTKKLNQMLNQYYSKGEKNTKAHINDVMSVFASGADFDKLYQDNKYAFYDLIKDLTTKQTDDINSPGILDKEIQEKFLKFKETIKNFNSKTSNSLGVFVDTLGVEEAAKMNKMINYFAEDNVSVEDLVKGLKNLKRMLYSSSDKYNKGSLTAINNTIVEIETFLDDIVYGHFKGFFSDLSTIAVSALEGSKEYVEISDDQFEALANAIVSSERHRDKMKNSNIWLTPFLRKIIKKSRTKDDGLESMQRIISNMINLYEKSGEGFFDKEGHLTQALTYSPKYSGRFSPRSETDIQSIVTDFIEDAFNNRKHKVKGKRKGKFKGKIKADSFDKKIRDVEDFVNVIFGEDVGAEIHEKLEQFKQANQINKKELKWIEDFLADKQNIVIGTEKMYRVAGLGLEFGDNYVRYGYSQRDPSQYWGSFAATRFVKIDRNNKRFKTKLFDRLMGSVENIDNTANLILVGKMTAMWANGDFDGDTFQALLNGAKNKELFEQVRKGSGELLDKTLKLQHLVVNSGDVNLFDEFSKLELTTANSKEIKKLIMEIYGGNDLTEASSNSEVFSKIQDYYISHKYYRAKIKEQLAEEIAKHSNTKLTGHMIDGISMLSLGDLNFSLSNSQVRRIINNEMSIKEFEDVLKNINFVSKKTIEELENKSAEEVFEALKKSLTPQGQLQLANLFGQKNKVTDMLSIARTGRFHDAISEYREFTAAFKQEEVLAMAKEYFAKEIDNYFGRNNKKALEELFENVSFTMLDDMFGDLIEQGSIGGKHGAQDNPYGSIEQMNRIARIIKRNNKKEYVSTKTANEFVKELLTEVDGLNSKVISDKTIGEYVTSLFLTGDNAKKTPQVQKKIEQLTAELGNMLGVTGNASNVKFSEIEGLKVSQLAKTLNMFNVSVNKGFMEKVFNIKNISRGLIHEISSKKSTGVKASSLYSNIHKTVSGKINGWFSTDTSGMMKILNKVTNFFKYNKEANEDIKPEVNVDYNELAKANAENTRFKTDGVGKQKNKVPDVADNSKYINNAESEEKRINILQEELEKVRIENENLRNKLDQAGEGLGVSSESINKTTKKTKQVIDDIAEGSSKAAAKAKEKIFEHKKGAMFALGLIAIGSFLKIFQSNRAVVNLDIDEKQYEKSQGSIYRDLNKYTINTNIRELY